MLSNQDINTNTEEEEEAKIMLSLHVEILDYIHSDLKNIVCREGNTLFDDEDYRLPLSLIMSNKLEDYFEPVLLSSRFKKILCDECAKRGELDSLIWARSKGCAWDQPLSYSELLKDFGSKMMFSSIFMEFTSDQEMRHLIDFSGEDRMMKRGICYIAAQAGHLHIIQWARENGCEWNDETCKVAVESGHWDIARWCIDNGCACSESMRTEILSKTS